MKSRYVFRASSELHSRDSEKSGVSKWHGDTNDRPIDRSRGSLLRVPACSAKENETVSDGWHLTVAGATESRIILLLLDTSTTHPKNVQQSFYGKLMQSEQTKISHKILDNYNSIKGKCMSVCTCNHVICIHVCMPCQRKYVYIECNFVYNEFLSPYNFNLNRRARGARPFLRGKEYRSQSKCMRYVTYYNSLLPVEECFYGEVQVSVHFDPIFVVSYRLISGKVLLKIYLRARIRKSPSSLQYFPTRYFGIAIIGKAKIAFLGGERFNRLFKTKKNIDIYIYL